MDSHYFFFLGRVNTLSETVGAILFVIRYQLFKIKRRGSSEVLFDRGTDSSTTTGREVGIQVDRGENVRLVFSLLPFVASSHRYFQSSFQKKRRVDGVSEQIELTKWWKKIRGDESTTRRTGISASRTPKLRLALHQKYCCAEKIRHQNETTRGRSVLDPHQQAGIPVINRIYSMSANARRSEG